MEVLIGKILETLILPPGLMIAMIVTGVLIRLRFYRTGQSFVYSGFALLILLSLPIVGHGLMSTTQSYPALTEQNIQSLNAKAIVILGGGRYPDAPEYRQDTINRWALERCRYGAYLQRKTKLPILITGGSTYNDRAPVGELMKQVLEESFISVVHWVEGKSRTTYENSIYSFELLKKDNIKDIVLVTHASHMMRSVEAFEKAGFNVTPAPMGFFTASTRPVYFQILPSEYALKKSTLAIHEWIGRLWYHLRYY